jgi:Xaa-Pro aminopeptidase
MGYVLKPGQTEPPPSVRRVFETLVNAIRIGITEIRAGMRGYEVDQIVRNHIRRSGYPDYNHATGHAIGELAHNPGTLIGPKARTLSK